jgi:hypothetical protein
MLFQDPHGGYCSTMAYFQPQSWPYHPPPSAYHVQNRAVIPPKVLPWYYTCEPMYLLWWLAVRVMPSAAGIGVVMHVVGVLRHG